MSISSKLKSILSYGSFSDNIQNIADSYYQWTTSKLEKLKSFSAAVSTAIKDKSEALANIASEAKEFVDGISISNVPNDSGYNNSFTLVKTEDLVNSINEDTASIRCTVMNIDTNESTNIDVATDDIIETIENDVQQVQSIQVIAKSISVSDTVSDVIGNLQNIANSMSIPNIVDSPIISSFVSSMSTSEDLNGTLAFLTTYLSNTNTIGDIDTSTPEIFITNAIRKEGGYTDQSPLGIAAGYVWSGVTNIIEAIGKTVISVVSFVAKAVVTVGYYAYNGVKKLWHKITDPDVLLEDSKKGDGSIFETSKINMFPLVSLVNPINGVEIFHGLFPWCKLDVLSSGKSHDRIIKNYEGDALSDQDIFTIQDLFPKARGFSGQAEIWDHRDTIPVQLVRNFYDYMLYTREWNALGMNFFSWITFRNIEKIIDGVTYVFRDVPMLCFCYRLIPCSVYAVHQVGGTILTDDFNDLCNAVINTKCDTSCMYNPDGTVRYKAGEGNWTQNKLLNGFLASGAEVASYYLSVHIANDIEENYRPLDLPYMFPLPTGDLATRIANKGWNIIGGSYQKRFFDGVFNDSVTATGLSVITNMNLDVNNDVDTGSSYVKFAKVNINSLGITINDIDSDNYILYDAQNLAGVTISYSSANYTCTQYTPVLFYWFMAIGKVSNVTNLICEVLKYMLLYQKSDVEYIPQRVITSLPASSWSILSQQEVAKKARNLIIGVTVAIVAIASITLILKLRNRIKANYEYANTKVFNVATDYANGTATLSDFNKALRKQRRAVTFQNLFNGGSVKTAQSIFNSVDGTKEILKLIR